MQKIDLNYKRYSTLVFSLLVGYWVLGGTLDFYPAGFFMSAGSIQGNVTPATQSSGCHDGSITLDISNSNGPFTYQWSTGETSSSISGLTAGEYCVTVMDNACGRAIGCWEVGCCTYQLEAEQIEYEVSHPACTEAMGELMLSLVDLEASAYPLGMYLSNLTTGYHLDLEILAENSSFANLQTGNYSAQINYGEGCSTVFDFTIESQPIALQLGETAACDNDGTIMVNIVNGKPPFTYAWNDDPSETESYRSGLISNTYTTTVTDANGCTMSASVFIKDVDPILLDGLDVVVSPTACDENTGQLYVIAPPGGGNPPFTYQWSTGDEGLLIKDLAGGIYGLTIMDDQGCSLNTEFEISVNGQPNIQDLFIENTCSGSNNGSIGVIALSTVNGSLTYQWSNGSTEAFIANLPAGDYFLTITETKNDCDLISTFTVENLINQPLEVNGNIANDCEGELGNNGVISLDIMGGMKPYDILWSNGATNSTVVNLAAGTYSATITDLCSEQAYYEGSITTEQVGVQIEVSFPNFDDVILETTVEGGTPPYQYLWNTGSTASFLVVQDEGNYEVTVTDQNGCTKTDAVDANCEPTDFSYISQTNCAAPFKLKYKVNPTYGDGPFKIKLEKEINQQFQVVDYRILSDIDELIAYEYEDDDAGQFRVTSTNFCGFSKTEVFNSCIDCDYFFYDEDDKYFIDVMGGLLAFELVCPCTNDCGFFGFTTDKVKLKLNQQALKAFQNSILGSPSFVIEWPTGPESIIYFNINENRFVVHSGPDEYTLSDDEFDSGITISVTMKLPYGVGEVCSLDIPIKFGEEGYNGYFYKWDSANPFSNYSPPYNWGTNACFFKCTVPPVSGVLYENEPIDYLDQVNNYYSECVDYDVTEQYFLYTPNDYENPCNGGGSILSHYESVIGIVTGEFQIPSNVALDQHLYWSGTMIEDLIGSNVPFTCTSHYDKGYCLFDSEDVYGEGIVLRDPIIVSYCKDREYDPIDDADEDGIPDDQDPCPYNPDVFCDGNDDGDDDGNNGSNGGGIDDNGCQTTFLPDQCKLAIVCPDEGVTYVDGVVEPQSYKGREPCIHCFTVDVCTVVHPDNGEVYSEAVGPINGSVTVELVDIPQCGGICGIWFTCTGSGEFIDYICAPDCITANDPICDYSDLHDIVALLKKEDGPAKYETTMTRKMVREIINSQRSIEENQDFRPIIFTIPNPSQSGGFKVRVESEFHTPSLLSIKNAQGKQLYEQEINLLPGVNEFVMDQPLTLGLYIISIIYQEKIISIKHVVQK